MSAPAIVLSAPATLATALEAAAAGCEEEGVPSRATVGAGTAAALARVAARESALGIGLGIDATHACVALASWPAPYLTGPLADARRLGQDAARIAVRRRLARP